MSILIVEDNPISAKVLDLNLSKAGYATILAVNGREALKCLELVPDIDLVITDLSMPEMDGFTLVSTMREHPEWSRIPVVVASAMGEVAAVQRMAEMGCKRFLVKPIRSSLLHEVVRTALDEQPGVLNAREDTEERLGIDTDLYATLAEEFASLVGETITQFEQDLSKQPASALRSELQVHLSEGATMFGADRVLKVLESLGAGEKDDDRTWEESECQWLLRELKVLEGALGKSMEGEPEHAT